MIIISFGENPSPSPFRIVHRTVNESAVLFIQEATMKTHLAVIIHLLTAVGCDHGNRDWCGNNLGGFETFEKL